MKILYHLFKQIINNYCLFSLPDKKSINSFCLNKIGSLHICLSLLLPIIISCNDAPRIPDNLKNRNSEIIQSDSQISLPPITVPDTLANHIIDSLLNLNQSPYFMDYNMPGTMQATAVQINANGFTFGLRKINLPVFMFQEDYFKCLKVSLALGTVNSLSYADELCSFIDDAFSNITKGSSDANEVLDELLKLTMSGKMKAVREKNRERIYAFGYLNNLCKKAKGFIEPISVFLSHAGNLKECLKIIVRTFEPIELYDGAEKGLRIIHDHPEGMSNELKGAIGDILTMVDDIQSTFLVNLKNSNREMFDLILNIGQQLYDDNEDVINNNIKKLYGKKGLQNINDFNDASDFFRKIADPVFPSERLLDELTPAYKFAMLENGIHRIVFNNIRRIIDRDPESRKAFVEAFKILLLTESNGWDKYAGFFKQLPPICNMGRVSETGRKTSQNAFSSFTYLSTISF